MPRLTPEREAELRVQDAASWRAAKRRGESLLGGPPAMRRQFASEGEVAAVDPDSLRIGAFA